MGERGGLSVEKVLLVDDWDVQLNQWTRDCRSVGKTPLRALTGEDAVTTAQRERPQLALVDVRLKEESGIAVTRKLKALDPRMFVVLTSGELSLEVALLGVKAGANDCFSKAVRCKEIIAAVEQGRRAQPPLDRLTADEQEWERVTRMLNEHGGQITFHASTALASNLRAGTLQRAEHVPPGLDEVATRARLYRALLDLSIADDPEVPIHDVIKLCVDATCSTVGRVELHARGNRGRQGERRQWQVGEPCTCMCVEATRPPVPVAGIDANVLCAPIGTGQHFGSIYLQRCVRSGSSYVRDRELVELVARQISHVAEHLLRMSALTLPEEQHALEVRRVREALKRHDGNVSEVARELGIDRKAVYRVLGRSR